jgi:predicted trehalose synthase
MNEALTSLRDVVADRIDGRWHQWAQAHPHLAAVIDRTTLVDSTVAELREDPAFQQAMHQADLDEARLAQAETVIKQADALLDRVMPLPW